MKIRVLNGNSPASQRGVSLVVAMVMLIVLTLVGVSSMNTAVVELKMAGSMQQQNLALNRADELLLIGEQAVQNIVDDPNAFDFDADNDGYYTLDDNVNVYNLNWAGQGLTPNKGARDKEFYLTEYLGAKIIPGESAKIGTDGRIIGGAVHTFRITARSTTGKNALRLVQSIYVTETPP